MERDRKLTLGGITLAAVLVAAGTSGAQTAPAPTPLPPTPQPPTPSVEQRLANQERRIGEGLKDGSLTAGGAARLQRGESYVNREWARDKADGVITPREQARMDRDLNRVSQDIYNQRHDTQRANPGNPFNQRLRNQADRIASGVQDGSLTNREAARLERGEARTAGEEARFRRDGRLGPRERARLDRDLNRASRDIYRARHNRWHR